MIYGHPFRFSMLILLLVSIVSVSNAQKSNIDSLQSVVDTSSIDSLKVDALHEIAIHLVFNNPDSADIFIDQALKLAESSSYEKGIAKSYNLYGIKHLMTGDNLEALENFQEAEKRFLELGMIKGAALCMNNIGIIYNKREEYRKAIKQYERSSKASAKAGDHRMHGYGYYNIASNYSLVESYDTAMLYIDSLEILESIHGPITPTYDLKADIFHSTGHLDSAEVYYIRAIEEGLEVEDLHYKSTLLLSLAEVQIEQNRPDEALKNLSRSYSIAKKNGFWEMVRDYYEISANLYADQGKYAEAYKIFTMYVKVQDSLIVLNNTAQINELNTKYQTAQKDQELAENKRHMEIQSVREEKRNLLFLTIFISIVTVSLVVLFFFVNQKKRNRLLSKQNEKITQQKNEIVSSINYAKKIQNSILIPECQIQDHLPSTFVYFRPKDIVSGDFYWFSTVGEKIIISAIDCTGHGVPGAFMSLIANAKLSKIINELKITAPAEILNKLHHEIVQSMHQKNEVKNAQDGMDISICVIDQANKTIEFAGAQNSVMIGRKDEITEYKGNALTIGGRFFGEEYFTSQKIDFKTGDQLYLYSDGYIDQFGGDANKKLNKKKFTALLTEVLSLNPDEAKQKLDSYLAAWRGKTPQLDDILVIGTRL